MTPTSNYFGTSTDQRRGEDQRSYLATEVIVDDGDPRLDLPLKVTEAK